MGDIKFPRECFNFIIDNQTYFDDARLCAFITVTQNFMVFCVSCFYCDATFSLRDWEEFTVHISREHCNNVKTFYELGIFEQKSSASSVCNDGVASNAAEAIKTQATSVVDDVELLGESQAYLSGEDEVADEDFDVDVDFNEHDTSSSAVHSTEDLMDVYVSRDPLMPNNYTESKNIIDVETSAPARILKLIDALEKYPPLWFMNAFNTKEHKNLFSQHLAQFSQKLNLNLTATEMLQSLSKLHVWFANIMKKKSCKNLTQPHDEFYRRCLEFLPDQENGKTCDLCQEIYEDHFQYFAHRRLSHCGEQVAEEILTCFTANADEYVRLRYPRFVAFSYECKICNNRKYAKKQGFVEHIKTHLDIAEHVCDICGKTFAKSRTYVKHKKRHAGLHRVLCKICGRDFDNFSLLTAHRKRYHTVQLGTIEEIQAAALKAMPKKKCFRAQSSAQFLVNNNDEGKSYACAVCGKTYKYKTGVHFHFKRHHM